ncbi:MAG: LptA/OstA family protein [Chthoniobacterales bacterium]|jgi:lipopolysaccharide transport protein LptA
MRIFCLSMLFGATIAVAPLFAQQTGSEDTSKLRQDPLGFGGLSKDRPKGSKTEISAEREATFNEKENRATFVGGVRVKDPAFLLSSDRLTVFLNRNRSGIERAVAEGNVVIVQQTDAGEKGAVGRARRAEYVPTTGVVTLIGWPEIQQGINRHIAASESTRMILNRDGRATTEGASRTVITDTEGAGGL